MKSFEFHATRALVIERGGAAKLGARLKTMGCRRVLIVTDAPLIKAGMLDPLQAGLHEAGIAFEVFSEVVADPPAHVIDECAARARAAEVDAVVGFGGGSSMDVAKLAALLAGSCEALDAVYGVNLAKGPRLPLVLVPTTAGTGSEVTPISIVTTGEGEKKGVVSPVLLPDLALLDAELTLGLPKAVTAATGIDAMVHAIEAFTSKRLKNPISDCLAREALRLLSGALHVACEEGSHLQAREDMLLGACLAGMAFANAPVAAVHALAYPIGARFHVPHGLSNALVLAPVMRFNLPFATPLYARLCDIVLPGTGGTEAARAAALVEYFEGLAGRSGLPSRLREVGITNSDVPLLAEDAMKQTRLLINNPRELGYADAVAIYQEVL